MNLFRPTRRQLIGSVPLLMGSTAFAETDPSCANTVFSRSKSSGPVRFIVVGDWGRNGKHGQQTTADAMARIGRELETEFVVSTGDNFYGAGVDSIDDSQWDSSFTRVYADVPGQWYAVLGNHDYGGNVAAQIDRTGQLGSRWNMPNHWHDLLITGPGIRPVHLFFFDTVSWIGKESFPFNLKGSRTTFESQQRQIRDMADRIGCSPPGTIKIGFGHHGIYSIGTHGGEMKMKQLDDFLRHFEFAAYVNGHDHCLYHITHQGMDYICSGAGSKVLADYTGGPVEHCVIKSYCDPSGASQPLFPHWQRFLAKSSLFADSQIDGGFAVFEIGTGGVKFTFYDSLGTPRHERPLLLNSASLPSAA